jgi:protein tyrosine/serine phosphatase
MNSRPVFKLITVVVICIGIFSGCSNFHEVTPGKLYRSRQLSGNKFDHFIKKYGIKTVINLRGASPGAKWYEDEMNTMRKDSVSHLDIHLSATHYVPSQKIDSIMKVADSVQKPILVHCQGGADRSGLFCASWRLKIEKYSAEKSSKQLSFIYGHIPFSRWSKTEAMDSSFNDYVRYLKNRE